MTPMTFLAVPAMLLASVASAAEIDGTWATRPDQCSAGYPEGRVTISGASIRFLESACTLTQPTALRDMPEAGLFDLQCNGEGMEWSQRTLVGRHGDNGLLIYSRGYATLYERC